MPYVSDMDVKGVPVTLHRVGIRALLTALAVAALVVVLGRHRLRRTPIVK